MKIQTGPLEIWWSSKLVVPGRDHFRSFAEAMAKRWVAGHMQYGAPNQRKKYMTRMELELKAYKKTGNAEHLRNIANYAALEDLCPENPKHHFNNFVDSVTRGKGLE